MSGQRSPQRQQQRQRIFCHECRHEWNLDAHGLACPLCGSEAVEIIEPDEAEDPRDFDDPIAQSPFRSPLLHWASTPHPSDPDEDDIGATAFGMRPSPFGGSFYTDRSPRGYQFSYSSGPRGMQYDDNPIFGQFASMIQAMTQPQQQQRRTPQHLFGPGMGPGVPFRPQSAQSNREGRQTRTILTSGGQGGPRREEVIISSGPNFPFTHRSVTTSYSFGDSNHAEDTGFRDVQMMMDQMFQGSMAREAGQQGGGVEGLHPLAALFRSVIRMGEGINPDAAYTQEEFDRIMTQIMENNTSGSAPGPASEAAIAALPRKAITRDMLDENTGKAECSICMDEVGVGEEVSELPCRHWFHHPCAEAWLKEHDTCPVCRAGIMPKEGSREAVRSPEEAPLHDQDPFLLARQESASHSSTRERRASRQHQHSSSRPASHRSNSNSHSQAPSASAPSPGGISSRFQSERRRHGNSAMQANLSVRSPSNNSNNHNNNGGGYSYMRRRSSGNTNNRQPESEGAAAGTGGAVSGFLERARSFLSGVGGSSNSSSPSSAAAANTSSSAYSSGPGTGGNSLRRPSSHGTSRR